MKTYIIVQAKERGCPIGSLNCGLYDRYYTRKEAQRIEIGDFPWYAQTGWEEIYFPENTCLISKDRLYDFDIRAAMPGSIYIVSVEFLALLKRFSAPIVDAKGVSVVSADGKPITTREYHVVSFGYEQNDVVDMNNSIVNREKNAFTKLVLRPDFKRDFFRLNGIAGAHDGIYCSEAFMTEAKIMGVKGIGFIPIEEFDWAKSKTWPNFDNYPLML